MPRAVVLQCPVCNGALAVPGNRDCHTSGELLETSKRHVSTHGIDESKAAIRSHQIVAEAREVIVSSSDAERLPTGDWQPPTATWLPDATGLAPETGPHGQTVARDGVASESNALD